MTNASPPRSSACSRTRLRTVVSDDLSGACEVAGVLHEAGHPSLVSLVADTAAAGPRSVVVTDLDVRDRTADEARHAFERIAAAADVGYVKIDSLLRGPIRGLVESARDAGRRVIFCPALPTAGRTVVDGVPLVGGVPLVATSCWSAESSEPPRSLEELLAPIPVTDAETASSSEDAVLIADATSDSDLERLAELVDERELLPVGSAGLLAALVRRLAPPTDATPAEGTSAQYDDAGRRPRPTLVAVGTSSPVAHDQVMLLASHGARVVDLDPTVEDPDGSRLLGDDGIVVVRWRQTERIDPAISAELDDRLATIVVDAAERDEHTPLVLTGGRTARTVLDRLGVKRLQVCKVAHHGAVVASTESNRIVAVRPGSFGDRWSLESLSNEASSFAGEGNQWT